MITNRILEWARRKPQGVAIIEGESATTYFEYARLIEAARRHFVDFNLPRGQFAFVFARTTTEHWVLTVALRALGLHTVAVPNLTAAAKLGLRNVACIVISEDVLGPSQTLPPAFKHARLLVVPRDIYSREITREPPAPSGDAGPGGGYLLLTSGTTGRYKKLLGGGPTEDGVIEWYMKEMATFDQHTIYHMLNFPAWTGIGAIAATIWHAGGCLAYSSRSDCFGDFFRHRPTYAMLVPALLPELLNARPPGAPPLADLELSITGGFLPLKLAERVSKKITPKLDVYYGSTEVCAFMRARFGTIDDLSWLSPVGQIEVADADGNLCPPGVEGELRVRLMDFDTDHYMDDAKTSAQFFRRGYFHPGDVAVRREDGRIRVLGRIEDVVNLSGFKVAVAPIEERIQRALDVESACVFSETNNEGEEEVVIAIESDRRPAADVLANAVKGMRGFKQVRWTFLDSFPRTEGGLVKVDRRKLRKLLD